MDNNEEDEDLEFHGGKENVRTGRKRLFDTPQEMQALIDDYFARCDPHIDEFTNVEWDEKKQDYVEKTVKIVTKQQPYTMSGLALALGFESRTSFVDYKGYGDDFSNTIKKARFKVEESVEHRMLSSQGVVAGVIFNAKNNFGWKDKSELVVNDPYADTRKKIGAFLDDGDDDDGSGSDDLPDDGKAAEPEDTKEV